ncbi:unnamed protein product [Paramecium primaurelia]|uniref:Kinesin motor domain-containing protein n=1 Tax=Paramecium primaurelia TaxID=5886 RepID=A0A8S1Q4F5_PARPR|nr:unnamed protein product [Paramecium primaurelia]
MENIQVVVRIRPSNSTERDNNDLEIWSVQNQDTITISNDRFNDLVRMRKFVPGQRVEFTFNQCFDSKHTTKFIYQQQIQRITLSSLQGINGTVFMYGQTGSGKTYTMMGYDQEEGILKQGLKDLFGEIAKQQDRQYFLRCSYVEIYTDQVYDLLATQERLSETLLINEDFNKEFVIKGAIEEVVTNINEIMDILQFGESNRHYASTVMNHCSSRSHTIFRLYVRCVPNYIGPNSVITESILNFVDLAGSEKINIHDSMLKKRGTSVGGSGGTQYKDRQNESKHINKSLFFLTQVISLRAQDKNDQHIPYRNSPLTKILRSSLGGNSRTAIILCINPCYSQFEQTLSTLRFGTNAKKIENNVSKNIVGFDNDESLNRVIKDYEIKINELQKARVDDKQQQEMMLKIIEKLEEQRKIFRQQFTASDHIQAMINKEQNYQWTHLHYHGVGVLWVPEKGNRELEVKQDVIDSFGTIKKYQELQEELIILKSEKQNLENQVLDLKQKQQETVIQTKKRYANQKTKTIKYKQLSKDLQDEKNKLLKIALCYHNMIEMDEMLLLNNDTLDQMTENLQIMMQNIYKVKLKKEIKQKGENVETLKLVTSKPIKYPKYLFDTSAINVQFWDVNDNNKKIEEQNKSEIESFQSYFQSQINMNSPSYIELQGSNQQFKEPLKHICSHEKSSLNKIGKENYEPMLKRNSSMEVSDELNFRSYFK